jgi:hypothetical protein
MSEIYRITLSQAYLGQLVQNVFALDDTSNILTNSGIADDVFTNWVSKVRIIQGAPLVYNQIEVRHLNSTSPAPYQRTISLAGNHIGRVPEPVLCYLVSLRSASAGPHGRGRQYWAAPEQECITNGVIASGCIDAFNTAVLNPIMARFGPGGSSVLRLVIAEPWTSGHSAPTVRPVINMIMRTVLGTQRRRNLGVGS